jgi:hypothetical protein
LVIFDRSGQSCLPAYVRFSPESDRIASHRRNDVKGQKATWLRSSGLECFAKLAITASVIAVPLCR